MKEAGNPENRNVRILVTGGAGFLGINLIRHLLDRGFSSITSLDIALFDYPEADRIRVVEGDIRDPEVVRRFVAGTNWVVHTAAALPLYPEKDIRSTEVDGTANLLRAALAQKVDRFIYISSTAVYGVPDHCPIRETDALIGVGPYGQAKIDAEKLCREYRRKGMCIPVIRPKSFIGPERLGAFELLYGWAREGRGFPVVGSGGNCYQLLDVEDLCRAILLCAFLPAGRVNDTFNIGARAFSTLKEDFQQVLDAAGHGKRIIGFPKPLAVAALRILELLRLSPLYRWIYETAGKDSIVSIEKAHRELGFEPVHSNSDALLRNFRWYLGNRAAIGKGSGVSHRKAWKHGLLDLIKVFF
jgi:nucleoside-diphosphate-sugar epimerase